MKIFKIVLILNLAFGIQFVIPMKMGTAFCQSLYLTHDSKPVNDSVLTFTCDISGSIVATLNVTNKTNKTINVKVRKRIKNIKDTVPGTDNTFCWVSCYFSSTYVSPDSIPIAAGATCKEFTGDYNPKGHAGATKVTYVFFDRDNIKDTSAVTFIYKAPTAINELSFESGELRIKAYPNPFNQQTVISYQLSENCHVFLNIYDIQGKQIASLVNGNMDKGKHQITFNANNLSKGVYYCRLLSQSSVDHCTLMVVR